MAKVEGRIKYTLIILSCSDSIFSSFVGRLHSLCLFSRMINFILMSGLKKKYIVLLMS